MDVYLTFNQRGNATWVRVPPLSPPCACNSDGQSAIFLNWKSGVRSSPRAPVMTANATWLRRLIFNQLLVSSILTAVTKCDVERNVVSGRTLNPVLTDSNSVYVTKFQPVVESIRHSFPKRDYAGWSPAGLTIFAHVPQPDRGPVSEAESRKFDSSRAHHKLQRQYGRTYS